MKVFIAFVIKELRHIVRDLRTLMLLFVIPVLLVLLFGFAITTEIKNATFAVWNRSNDQASISLVNKISSSGYFVLKGYVESEQEVAQMFESGTAQVVLVIPDDFAESLAKGEKTQILLLADASDPNIANTLGNYLKAIVADFQQDYRPMTQQVGQLDLRVRMWYNPRLESSYYFVPGVVTVIITLISAMMTSVSIAREKELGTLEVLLVSPMRPLVVVLAKAVPYMGIALLNTFSVLALSRWVFHMPFEGSLVLIGLLCLLFVMTVSAMGLFISSIVSTQRLALLISLVGLFLPTMLLSGFIFPIESMPLLLQWLSSVLPARWFIYIIKALLMKGSDFMAIWKESAILLGMTLFFFALSIKNFKNRLE